MRSNIQVSTTPTLHFLVSIQRLHLKMGELLSINVKLLLLGTYQIGRFKLSEKYNRLFILTLNCSKYFKVISSSYTKYRAIAFNLKKLELLRENQSIGVEFSFIHHCLLEINQSELSIF